MYYSKQMFQDKRDGMQGWNIGIAQSTDLYHWSKVGEIKPTAPYEQRGLCAPGALVKDGKIHLFYQTYGNGPKDAICHAWSEDGINFNRDASNPIFAPHGSWTNGRAIDAEICFYQNQYYLYFATRDSAGLIQKQGVATAPANTNFSRQDWKQASDDAILAPSFDWEGQCIEAASVIKRNDKLYMFYAGSYNNMPQQIGVAESKDGIHWQRVSEKPFLANGRTGSWNSSESGHPGIFEDENGQTYLFFQGNNDRGKSWYLSNIKIGWKENGPCISTDDDAQPQGYVWSAQKANSWYKEQPWLRGCNYQPSSAINQLEMFQEETFDEETIDRELGWAEGLGLNCMRVFLHHTAWTSDRKGFKDRLEKYLQISTKHKIKTILVFFDDCWNDNYHAGKQPEPRLGIHNSGWVRDPGTAIRSNADSLKMLEEYVTDIITAHRNDNRIVMWDLYNEPGNSKYVNESLPLLKSIFAWARKASPSQPLTSGVWRWDEAFSDLNEFQLKNSDVITYHCYSYSDVHKRRIADLKQYGRPLICTEYMARRNGSLFQTIMPILKSEKIGAINWGFVSGKTNTIFAWDTPINSGKEPELWFHDILRKDGTPFSRDEIATIKTLTVPDKKNLDKNNGISQNKDQEIHLSPQSRMEKATNK